MYEQFWKEVGKETETRWRVETRLGERKEWLRVPVPLRVVIGELVMALNFITTRLLTENLCYADHGSDIT